MIKTFAYNAASLDSSAIDIVEGALTLARQSYENKKDADYDAKNAVVLNAMAQYAIADTKFASRLESVEEALKGETARKMFNESMVRNNTIVRSNFELILAQVITAINPEVSNDIFSRFIAETRQIGYGDTAVFRIESNDLFAVKEGAEGIRRTVDQPLWDDEITVHPHLVSLGAHIDWYPFAAGRFDMGNFAAKIARSFAAYIFVKAVKGLTAATTQFGAGYQAGGVAANLWTTLAQKVQAANGGMNVIAVGTKLALSNCALGGNYQVEIGEEMNKVGYLDQYQGIPLIAVENVLAVGSINSNPTLLLPDDRIYMIPVAGDKPVKIVFEGNQTTVTDEPSETSDVRLGLTVSMRVGVSAICGSKFGTVII